MGSVTCVVKRDGSTVLFNPSKINSAVSRAITSLGTPNDGLAEVIAKKVLEEIEELYTVQPPSVEQIQDVVEKVLIKEGHAEIAKTYILYRQKRKEYRESRAALLDGRLTNLKISDNSLLVFRERYLLQDENGKIKETPEELFKRVAKAIAQVDKDAFTEIQEKFYNMLVNFDFLPSSPTLMNAGTDTGQLLPAHVLPVPDDIAGIYETLKNAVIIHKYGGGTGFSFSNLRPKDDIVGNRGNISSGPIALMGIFDSSLGRILQNGKRQGANMAVLRVDHPDILEFITLKEKSDEMKNFNLSVAITDDFMKAVQENSDFPLRNPRTNKVTRTLPAKQIFDLLLLSAWRTGDPGVLFIDRINQSRSNPFYPHEIVETTNPCGEQPLFPYEACPFGSINLSRMVESKKINFQKLKSTIQLAVRFLDNIIDVNYYPIKETELLCKQNRRIGLGIMGFADMLFQLGVAYDSDLGVETGKLVIKTIAEEARKTSEELADEKGAFPNFKRSIYSNEKPLRNASITTISPTGSISTLSDCSPGIEPVYGLSFIKRALNGKELFYFNQHFANVLKEKGIYSEDLMKNLANIGTIQTIKELPEDIKAVFKVSHDITPYWHVKMQSAFQEYVDNAISKTVNFPNWASLKDVEEVFLHAYKYGCKGITIYRDGSKDVQVLSITAEKKIQQEEPQKIEITSKVELKQFCPECSSKVYFEDNCAICANCGYSVCNVS